MLDIIWTFNKFGRLVSVDANVGENRLRVLEPREEDKDVDWITANFAYKPLPAETAHLNREFKLMQTQSQYKSLAQYGHGLAAKIIANLSAGAIEHAKVLRRQGSRKKAQKQLTEISNDIGALYMLHNISMLSPYVKKMEKSYLRLSYA